MKLTLNKPFGANAPAHPEDVRALKVALNHLGYYIPPEDIGLSDTPDPALVDAVKTFQGSHGLQVDGRVKPDGETLAALNEKGEKAKKVKRKYIWHTVGDNRVRPAHDALEGMERTFGEGLDPGEDPGCRCWAVPVPKKDCEEERARVAEAEARVRELTDRLHDLMIELNQLIEEKNAILKRAEINFAIQGLASWIASVPIAKIGDLEEMLRRYFGVTITAEMAKAAETLKIKLNRINRKIDYIGGQFSITLAQLKNSALELEVAKNELEKCLNGLK